MTTTGADEIRIVLIDAQTLFRTGLRLIIERQPGIKIVGDTGDLQEGLAIIKSAQPDIILFDTNCDGDGGLIFVMELEKVSDQSKMVLVTGCRESQFLVQAVQYGVFGIVLKTQSPNVLIKAIEKVLVGEAWIDHTVIANLLTNLSRANQSPENNAEAGRITKLSEREKQIIRLIGQGMQNHAIAKELSISEVTVRHHLTSIYAKLDVSNRLELLVFAHRYILTD